MFKPINPNVTLPQLEEEKITSWKENKTFEKSISNRPENKKWTFLDGPPFVTGLPHYGHLLTSIAKDVFPRYWTMRGYQVRRVWGWDGHGLPIENKVENKLEIKRKKDIEEVVGVKKFIDECYSYVQTVSSEWEWYVDHIARWVDFEHAYKTWDTNYMESVMWVFKQMYDKGHIYKGLRVSLYCPHCSTPISNFEVAMDQDNYKEIAEPSNTYKYQVVGEEHTFFLAWSTTPWTKLATPALAVNPKFTYVKVHQGDEFYILAKTTLKSLNDIPYEIVEEFSGASLLGKAFVPHYDFTKLDEGKKAYVVVGGDFVTAEDGTGIVTLAAYGEEDLAVLQKEQIQLIVHLDEEGHIKPEVPKFGGMYYLKANAFVNEDLTKRGLMYSEKEVVHKIPTCWRCHTRLYYSPQNAWYVNIQDLKPALQKNNEAVNWFPEHFKKGRFAKSIDAAPDWCISRNRYWGSPVPVWECECGERVVPGSIAELEKLSGKTIKDLHKPEIDEVTIPCQKCAETMHRVPEVLDSWIEAGSAPFAERHFPFDGITETSNFFPPDFIVEYTGQIRAWFYVLHVISTILYDVPAFKNVIVNGVILGTDGRKMSKNFGNYPDPKELMGKYGGDALRLYLMGSPVMYGEDTIISEEQYRQQMRGYLLILWNSYNFFITYANNDGWDKESFRPDYMSSNVLDQWIQSLLHSTVQEISTALSSYDTMTAVELLKKFVEEFSTWYIRRSRDRVGPAATSEADRTAFYNACYEVLITLAQISAPITPFISEEMYQNLTGEPSVHLTDWPRINGKKINKKIEEQMILARKVVEVGHAHRKESGMKVRQPLGRLTYTSPEKLDERLESVLLAELNIKVADYEKGEFAVLLDTTLTPELKAEGEARDIIRKVQEERKKLGTAMSEKVNVTLPIWPQEFEEYIKKRAMIEQLVVGEPLVVTKV